MKIEIEAAVADGVPSKTVADVSKNARTLEFTQVGLEGEAIVGNLHQ